MYLRRDKCKVVVPAFSSKISYELKSWKMNFKALKYTFSSFSVFSFEKKCQIRGQKLKFDIIKHGK